MLQDASTKLTRFTTYPNGEYHLGTPTEIIDEGAFYRIDGTHILDEFKIESVDTEGDKVTIHM